MDKLLVTFGFHENERDFGRLVQDAYSEKFGQPENVLFHEITTERDVPGGVYSTLNYLEIVKIQKDYQPSLTIDVHHTRNSIHSSSKEPRSYFSLETSYLTCEWELAWLEKLIRNSPPGIILYEIELMVHEHFYPYNCIQLEAEDISISSVQKTVELISYLFSSHSEFHQKMYVDEKFQREVKSTTERIMNEEQERAKEAAIAIKQAKDDPGPLLTSDEWLALEEYSNEIGQKN